MNNSDHSTLRTPRLTFHIYLLFLLFSSNLYANDEVRFKHCVEVLKDNFLSQNSWNGESFHYKAIIKNICNHSIINVRSQITFVRKNENGEEPIGVVDSYISPKLLPGQLAEYEFYKSLDQEPDTYTGVNIFD